ncbi:MAG: glutamine--tRNA ligase/YqeY domain fusion protein [Clostridiales bacterium]|nr:glutamine--tRNA ligase/YqeY domain fusion protein [Clostridiales bacterium]
MSKKINDITEYSNFIHKIIDEDLKNNKHNGRVHTRFPPEPNGHLHIGHAKAIYINFETANKYNGLYNLRFDDTNPTKEDEEYVDSIINDIKWLGYDWGDRLFFASDYFDQLYDYAVQLIKLDKAFVCDLNADEMRKYRGTLTEKGKNSPFRNRSIEENLVLFERMKNGEFNKGKCVLRAKIDMKSPNLNLRDPIIYRILHAEHDRTGDKWCIYPMYDYTHPISDAIEGITHSLCSLEFEDHRPFYDWLLDTLKLKNHPQQIEFARLNITNTVMSKRKLRSLVEEGLVDGWDDPRMPTISGLRRRGYTPKSIREFCDIVGVAKNNSVVDIAMLEHCIREDLDKNAKRGMAILKPLRVVIENYPEDKEELLIAENHPKNLEMGTRKMPFSKIIYIERDDFLEDPPKKFFRLAPGREVRLKHAYFIKCVSVIKDEQTGHIIELRCTYDPETKSGSGFNKRKVKGTLHWVSEKHSLKAEVRLYDNMMIDENEGNTDDLKNRINKKSIEKLPNCLVEQSFITAKKGDHFQFLRHGYFIVDTKDTTKEKLVFNRTVTLRDTWAKISKMNK